MHLHQGNICTKLHSSYLSVNQSVINRSNRIINFCLRDKLEFCVAAIIRRQRWQFGMVHTTACAKPRDAVVQSFLLRHRTKGPFISIMCHRRAQTGLLVQNQFSNKLISYSFGSLCICNQLSHESVLRRNIEGHFWCFSAAPRLCFVLDRNVGNISYLWNETLSLGGRQKNLFFVGFSEQLHSYEPAHSYCLNCLYTQSVL